MKGEQEEQGKFRLKVPNVVSVINLERINERIKRLNVTCN